MAAEPWQTAETPGPTKALVITKPEVVVAMVKKAKRPILVVGHEAVSVGLGEEKAADYAIRMAKAAKIPVVATAHIAGDLIKGGLKPAAWMTAMDIANRLKDAEWAGLDGAGRYDLALFMGLPYHMEWVMLSGLKHFSHNLKTVSLDRFYQPNATWSFPNLPPKDWGESLKVIVSRLEGE